MDAETARYEAPSAKVAWAETVIGTLLIPIIGLAFHRQDPLFLTVAFAWLIFPPLLFGIRYGFAHGFSSALLTVVLMVLEWRYASAAPAAYPFQYALTVLVVGMIAGQFADTWLRRLGRAQLFNDYAETRLNTFRRSYQELKVSHDQLEERLASDTFNPRAALMSLRQRFHAAHDPQLLHNHGGEILELLAAAGQIQRASLYEVSDNRRLGEAPLASLGEAVACPADHPMLRECLERKTLIALRSGDTQLLERFERQGLLAVLPLVDVRGHIWAVVAIAAMPFVVYSQRALNLLAVLAANLGDLVAEGVERSQPPDDTGETANFRKELALWSDYAKRFDIDATLMGVWLAPAISSEGSSVRADQWVLDAVRGVDVATRIPNDAGGHCVVVLMPMTNATGAAGYRKRIARLLEQRLGRAPDDSVLKLHERRIDGKQSPEALFAKLIRECGHVRL